MAVIMAVGGDEVMTSEQFAAWFEGQAPSRETGARFVDELRREVGVQPNVGGGWGGGGVGV